MRKSDNPLYNVIIPNTSKGSLEDKFKALLDIQERIMKISSDKDTQPSEKLLDKRGELEVEISRHLTDGETLSDSFMDYCIRHFNGGYNSNINGENIRRPSVFDIIPEVKLFTAYIEKARGQRILSTYDNLPTNLGVINGNCEFSVGDRCFRYLEVPVKQLWQLNKKQNKWEQKSGMFNVNPDIFSHPGLSLAFNGGKAWSTDYSGEMYIGGPGPQETSIYVGDKEVDAILQRDKKLIIPAKEISIARAPKI